MQFAPCSFSPEMQNLHRKLTDLLQEKADMQTRLREKYSKWVLQGCFKDKVY
jgi:hypothetical protein